MGEQRGSFLQIGGVVAGLGGTFAAGYWIFARETEGVDIWAWQMWIAVGVIVFGLALMVRGAFNSQEGGPVTQSQRGGKKSQNYQAGRDLTVGEDRARNEE